MPVSTSRFPAAESALLGVYAQPAAAEPLWYRGV